MTDKWDGWSCIPGRICGGSQLMREAADEIERLSAEGKRKDVVIEALRDFVGANRSITFVRSADKRWMEEQLGVLNTALADFDSGRQEQNDGQ